MLNETKFLERLIAAGDDGLPSESLTAGEHKLAGQMIHDGDAAICEVGPKDGPRKQFVVAAFGAHHRLYILRGWAKRTQEGLTITNEGMSHLKLVPLSKDDL